MKKKSLKPKPTPKPTPKPSIKPKPTPAARPKAPRKKRATSLAITTGPIEEQEDEEMASHQYAPTVAKGAAMFLQLTATQQCLATAVAESRPGRPASVADVVWTSTDPSVVTVTPDATDPLKALIVAKLAGTAQVKVEADADLGDGVILLSDTVDVVVVAAQATTLTITLGAVEEQPTA